MSNVNAALYDLLKEHETGMYGKGNQHNEVIAYVHIDFGNVRDFVEIMGYDYFAEGGIEARIMPSSVCVEINDAIEHFGHNLSDYKRCFDEDVWEQHESRIKEMEA
jgi:hypothetical protein